VTTTVRWQKAAFPESEIAMNEESLAEKSTLEVLAAATPTELERVVEGSLLALKHLSSMVSSPRLIGSS
jgi:hypothetical protein